LPGAGDADPNIGQVGIGTDHSVFGLRREGSQGFAGGKGLALENELCSKGHSDHALQGDTGYRWLLGMTGDLRSHVVFRGATDMNCHAGKPILIVVDKSIASVDTRGLTGFGSTDVEVAHAATGCRCVPFGQCGASRSPRKSQAFERKGIGRRNGALDLGGWDGGKATSQRFRNGNGDIEAVALFGTAFTDHGGDIGQFELAGHGGNIEGCLCGGLNIKDEKQGSRCDLIDGAHRHDATLSALELERIACENGPGPLELWGGRGFTGDALCCTGCPCLAAVRIAIMIGIL